MLQLIKEYDYNHYAKLVQKLGTLIENKENHEERMIYDFLVFAQRMVEVKLDTLNHSGEYLIWCLSDDAQDIVLFAKSISENRSSNNDSINDLIQQCANELMYLISIKCARFYTED